MKKLSVIKFFCLLILGVFIFSALFPDVITLGVVKWQLNTFCKKRLRASICYDQLAWQNGQVVVTNAVISKEGSKLIVDRATFNPNIGLLSREIGGDLEINNAVVVFQKQKVLEKRKKSIFPKIFKTNLNIHVSNVSIELYDPVTEMHETFSGELSQKIKGKEMSGVLSVFLENKKPPCTVHFNKNSKKAITLEGIFHQHQIEVVAWIFNYFFNQEITNILGSWKCNKGAVEGCVKIAIFKNSLQQVDAHIRIVDIGCENKILGFFGGIDQLKFDLEFDLTHFGSLHAWNGDIIIHGGRVAMHPLTEQFDLRDRIWNLSDLNANFCIRKGQIAASELKGYLMGMEGEITLDWQAPSDILMRMQFSGDSRDIGAILPGSFQTDFCKSFPQDQFHLEALVKREKNGLQLEGNLNILEEQGIGHRIDFGCLFGDHDEGEMKAISPNFPFSFSESMDLFVKQLKEQFCLSTKRLGWIEGRDFPIKKFMSPFLLKGTQLSLAGNIQFEAVFDERYLIFFYDVSDVSLESQSFRFFSEGSQNKDNSIVLPNEELKYWRSQRESIRKLTVGERFFTLNERKAIHYFDLNSGRHVGFLPLKETTYDQKNLGLHFERSQALVHFDNQKITIQNIETKWNHLSFTGHVAVDIKSLDDVDLKIDLSSIEGPLSDAQAFLGSFSSSYFWHLPLDGDIVSDLFLHFSFSPKVKIEEGKMAGHFRTSMSHGLFSISNFCTQFTYEFGTNQFELLDGSGIGHLENNPKEIPFTIPVMRLKNLPKWDAKLQLELVYDHKNYSFEAEASLFNGNRSFSITSNQDFGLSLSGIQTGTKIRIPEITWQEWQGLGDLDLLENLIFNFEMTHPDFGEIACGGEFNLGLRSLIGEIRNFRIDLQPALQKHLSTLQLKGIIHGEGTFFWNAHQEDIEISTVSSVENFEIGEIQFGHGENVHCFFSKKSGLTIEGLEIEIPSVEGVEQYKLGRIVHDFKQNSTILSNFDFSIPSQQIFKFSTLLERTAHLQIHHKCMDLISALKPSASLEGKMELTITPGSIDCNMTFKDGLYHVLGREFELQHLSLAYNSINLQIQTELLFRNHLYAIEFQTDSTSMTKGDMVIRSNNFSKDDTNAIVVTWEREQFNWSISKIQGNLLGLNLDLNAPSESIFSDQIRLSGKAQIAINDLLPYAGNEIQKFFKLLSISGTYTIEGNIRLSKKDFKKFTFDGSISGNQIVLGGIDLASVSSKIECSEHGVVLNQFAIKDWAGRLFLNTASIAKSDLGWQYSGDLLQIEELRFSRIRNAWIEKSRKDHPLFKALFLPSLVLKDISGVIGDAASFRGTGNVSFTNLPKKTIFSNILLLPTEITARIGLDLSALVPAQGDIRYEIKGGKIYLTKFKKVYSDGKRSRFYLAQGYSSYIDFQGNLNLKIKMKQYNLLMKLAELFTVTVKGPCLRPSIAFSTEEVEKDI